MGPARAFRSRAHKVPGVSVRPDVLRLGGVARFGASKVLNQNDPTCSTVHSRVHWSLLAEIGRDNWRLCGQSNVLIRTSELLCSLRVRVRCELKRCQ